MRVRIRASTVVAIAIFAIALNGCDQSKVPTPIATSHADALPKIADLEKLALDECLCAMAGAVCEPRFDKATASLKSQSETSASTPLSTTAICFPQLSDACVTRAIQLTNGGPQDFVCTGQQAGELEDLFQKLLPHGGAMKPAEKAIRHRIEQMKVEVRRQRDLQQGKQPSK